MEYTMRDILLNALKKHAEGHVEKHRANVEVYLHSTTGIGEHPDIVEAMEAELMEIAKYDDVLAMLEKYFDKP
jgi:hypothetical protein